MYRVVTGLCTYGSINKVVLLIHTHCMQYVSQSYQYLTGSLLLISGWIHWWIQVGSELQAEVDRWFMKEVVEAGAMVAEGEAKRRECGSLGIPDAKCNTRFTK